MGRVGGYLVFSRPTRFNDTAVERKGGGWGGCYKNIPGLGRPRIRLYNHRRPKEHVPFPLSEWLPTGCTRINKVGAGVVIIFQFNFTARDYFETSPLRTKAYFCNNSTSSTTGIVVGRLVSIRMCG